MKKILFLLAALVAAPVFGQTAAVRWELRLKGSTAPLGTYTTQTACDTAARARNVTAMYECPRLLQVTSTAPVVCDPAPAASSTSSSAACPAGQTGVIVTTVTTTYTRGAAPACVLTTATATTTSGACTPIVVPPPPTGAALYFSDCQEGAAPGCVPGSNANPGTQALPKQNLAGVNYNTMPPGSLLFKRGGAWNLSFITLNNPNTSAAAPLVFDAYGTGPAPLVRTPSGNTFNLGGGWNNTTDDGGYVIRNLKIDGLGTGEWGVWFVQNVRDVIMENNEITGFRIAINSNEGAPFGVRGVTLRNNNIHHNRAMGLLGHYDDLLLEGNTIEANNFGGSNFDHGTYIGGGRNVTLRNNRYIRNSAVNGTCTGGNMTFHGQIDGLLIEGNVIEQDASAPTCYLMSITQGYTTAEWFRNAIVRNNTLINGGSAIVAQSAPGIVVEGNRVIRTQPITTPAVSIGGQYAGGDEPDANAIVRNNTLCLAVSGSGGSAASVNSPGATLANNVVLTGAAATTGVCAR